jgi:hypothetical protein
MIILETSFESGAGGYSQSPLKYVQVVRNEKFAVYQRFYNDDRPKDFEVFRITILKEGTKVFNNTITEDTEQYPSNERFGKTAWTFDTLELAMARYNKLIAEDTEQDVLGGVSDVELLNTSSDEVILPKKRGKQPIPRPVLVLPSGQFTMNDLEASNPEPWNRALIYVEIQKQISSGKVKEVGFVEKVGKGKKPVLYSAV